MARELLKQVKVASPCHVAWSEMQGDDRTRYCQHCKLNVFNLSDMTDREAEALLRGANGRLCVRYYQRADGTVMTRNCPVGLAAVRKKLAIGVMSAAALVISAFGFAIRPAAKSYAGQPQAEVSSVAIAEDANRDYWQAAMDWLCGSQPEPQEEVVGQRVVVGAIAPPSSPPPSPTKP
jgi:hypothetical protein